MRARRSTRERLVQVLGFFFVAIGAAAQAQHAITRVSVDSSGVQGDGDFDWQAPALSSDGRYVAFGSEATNLVSVDGNGSADVFVRDRATAPRSA